MELQYSKPVMAGKDTKFRFIPESNDRIFYKFDITPDTVGVDFDESFEHDFTDGQHYSNSIRFPETGDYTIAWGPLDNRSVSGRTTVSVLEPDVQAVALVPGSAPHSEHTVLWKFISDTSDNLRFNKFSQKAISKPKCKVENWYGTISYNALMKTATTFVDSAAIPGYKNRGITPTGAQKSYVDEIRKLDEIKGYAGTRRCDYLPLPNVPFVELIWNYWMEEGMLVQTLNRILARFQNRVADSGSDPLQRLSANPLVPLRSLLWGFAETERDRLSVRRRAAEYEYQYGLHLLGRAIPPRSLAVERRTPFLEAFHNLLHSTYLYYKEHDDKTVDADAFPLLSGLRELHLILAYGANNQFADLPLTARREMLVMQWILAQSEMREFLGGRTMVPYEEPWMDRVDSMKQIQHWSDASISHFFDLAVHGEMLLLSVRHGRWNDSGMERADAENWALRWRNSIQRYIHAYRAVTGVDLTESVDATMPSVLIARRLRLQSSRA